MTSKQDRLDVQVARGILIAVLGIATAAVILWSAYEVFSRA
jgi:hypothetical protein